MPTDPRGRAEVMEWVIAALNSVDLPSQPWALFRFMGFPGEAPEAEVRGRLPRRLRLERMEAVLAGREWLVGRPLLRSRPPHGGCAAAGGPVRWAREITLLAAPTSRAPQRDRPS